MSESVIPDKKSKRVREHLPAIVDGKLVRVSPSQVDTFKVCPRKWAYGKVFHAEKIEAPYDPTKGKDLGTKCHEEIEEYLLTGEDSRCFIGKMGDEILSPFQSFAPFRGGPGLVEPELLTPSLETPGGVVWTGYIDFFVPIASRMVLLGPTVIDHKFKSDIRKNGKTREQLKTDTQAVVYSWWAIERTQTDECEFRHHNHQTNPEKPRVEAVGVVLERAHLESEFAKLCAIVDGPMQSYASAKKPEDVPIGATQPKSCCWAFGPCEYSLICPSADPGARKKKLAQLEEQKIKQQKKEGTYMTQAMKAEEGKWYVVNGQVAKKFGKAGPKIKFELPDGQMIETGLLDDVVESTVIPEATVIMDKVPESAPMGRLFVNVTPPGQRISGSHATIPPAASAPMIKEYPPAPTPVSTLPPIETPTAPPPPAAKRGRPKKEKTEPQGHPALHPSEPKLLEEVVAEQLAMNPMAKIEIPPVSKEQMNAAIAEVKAELNTAPKVRIYVEMPVSGEEKKSLEPYVQEIRTKLEEKYKIPDARLAPDKSDLAYGRWKAIIQIMAQANPPAPGAYEAFRGEFSSTILEGLRSVEGIMIAGYILK